MILSSTPVQLGEHSYPIHLAEDFKDLAFALKEQFQDASRFVVITERNVSSLYGKFFQKATAELGKPIQEIYIKGGEKNKHIDRVKKTYQSLLEMGADRKSVVIAFGGGVVGDFSGFVAATYQRGVRFVQIPTTLLAGVDSSVGGKVAVNLDGGKNMVGAFHQPSLVYFPLFTLSTLPTKEWNCGLAEILKHGFLAGGDLLKELCENNRESVHSKPEFLRRLIEQSVQFKASVVSQDEKETGLRAILNLGHTTGHAIESLTKYKKYSHGEAVAIGLGTALILSHLVLGFPESEVDKGFSLLRQYKLPTLDNSKAVDLVSHMSYDKKKEGNQLKFILLQNWGEPKFGVPIDRHTILEALKIQKKKGKQ